MATREQLIEDFADHKYATGEKFAKLINSMKVVQDPVTDPAASGTSLSFIDSISQDADGKITATKKTLDLANAHELNPFKGWYKTGDTLPTDGFDGAYLYFKDTTQNPAVTTIYRWNGTAYADTGTEVDESNVQTFASGQAVNEVGIDNEPTAGSGNLVKSGGVADLSGAFIMEANIPQSSTLIMFSPTIKVDRAPIEITIDVLSNTASFEESPWLGIVVAKQGAAGHFNNLVEDNGKFYFKETSETYIESTEFKIYVRKCTVAGTLKIRVNTNNGKATLVKRIGEIESSISTIGDNIEQTSQEVDLIKEVMPTGQGGWKKKDGGIYTLINITSNNGTRLKDGRTYEASSSNALITDWIPIQEGKRIKLRTIVANLFDGVAYYSSNNENSYLGNDVFHADTFTTIESELTIPANATYMRFATADKNTAYEVFEWVDTTYLPVASEKYVDDMFDDVLPHYTGWRKLEGDVYDLRNVRESVGTRLENGVTWDSVYEGSLITGWIPIDRSKRYKLKTVIRSLFNGIAYYSGDTQSTYIGHDIFYKDNSTPEVIEAELTIPVNATYMRCATFNQETAYELSEYIEKEYLPVASEEYVQEQLEEYTPSTEYINSLIDAKNEPIEEDIDYLYGVVSAGSTPPELAVRYVPTIQLFLGSNILDISDVTYDSNFWTIENNLPKYLGGTGGGQSKTFRFNAATINEARYLCDMVTLTQDSAYENLFYLRIGNGPLIDPYNGSRTTFGGLVSDGGYFEIVPYGTKAFDVTAITLKPLVNSEDDTDYTQTRSIPVNNIDAGNSASTLIDGKWNVAVGPTGNTMASNVNGSRSVAIGLNALKNWKYGLQNVAIGTFALSLLEEGNHNIAIGSDCMWQCKKAQDNVVIGRSALGKTGEYAEMLNNVAIGFTSMGSQQSSSRDSVSIGYKSNIYGAAYSVFIGSNCTTTSANQSITNAIAIGYNARATKSNQCVLGNASVNEFVLGNKKLIFNQDGTVSWEAVG